MKDFATQETLIVPYTERFFPWGICHFPYSSMNCFELSKYVASNDTSETVEYLYSYLQSSVCILRHIHVSVHHIIR